MVIFRSVIVLSALISGFSCSLEGDQSIPSSMPSLESIQREYRKHLRFMNNGTKILVLMCRDVEDIELTTVLTILRKSEIRTEFGEIKNVIATLQCEYELSIVPDLDIKIIMEERPYEMIILPGGKGYVNYIRSKPLRRLLKEQDDALRYIGAMSTAPLVLQEFDMCLKKNITCYPAWKPLFYSSYKIHDVGVVHDGNLVTCQGPTAAMEFALHIVEIFKGKDKADELSYSLGYRRNLSDILVINPHKI
ncbi:protein dj-1beta-like [Lycorma delicatula]|uniref:protein dj-1beta-like n=1 Tax=Lycorma delicatula TaxID=130591 RepID=UPI003F515E3A